MKVLVIGGTGILSTDVVEYAYQNGMEVTCINRGKHLQFLHADVTLLVADIRDVEEIKKKTENEKYDVVIDFLSYTLNDLKRTLSIFNNKCKQFIFISSATVYNKSNPNEIIREDVTKIGNSVWDYANNKVECEKYLRENLEKTGQIYTIIRPYVTYGKTRIPFPVTSSGRYWSLVNRILCDKPIIMPDDGNAICTLTHTSEFCKGVVGLFGNEKAYNEAFHITSSQTYSWNEVLHIIEKAINKQAHVLNIAAGDIEEHMPMYKGSLLGDKATNMCFDNSKIKNAVPDFECNFTFEEGIQDTIFYFKNNDFMREVDYKWDCWMDNYIREYCRKNHLDINYRVLRCKNAERSPQMMEMVKYYMSKYRTTFILGKAIQNFFRK